MYMKHHGKKVLNVCRSFVFSLLHDGLFYINSLKSLYEL